MSIQFEIPGPPVAKGRARAFVRGGKVGHFTPKKTEAYESSVRLFAAQAMAGAAPMDGPIELTVIAFLPIPPSWPKKKQADALAGSLRPTGRPDLDNIVKAVKDGMNGIVWRDDSQVVDLAAGKRYSDRPRVDVVARVSTQ